MSKLTVSTTVMSTISNLRSATSMLTQKMVSDALGIPPSSLQELMAEGQLPYYKLFGKTNYARFDGEVLADFLEQFLVMPKGAIRQTPVPLPVPVPVTVPITKLPPVEPPEDLDEFAEEAKHEDPDEFAEDYRSMPLDKLIRLGRDDQDAQDELFRRRHPAKV